MESYTTELFTTTKNRPSLVVNGYQHRIFYKSKTGITWKCTKQKTQKCLGRVRTDLNNIVIRMYPHCCVINTEELEMKKAVEKIKKRVRDDIHSPVGEIFKKEVSDCEFSEKLRYRSMKRNLNRIRKEVLTQKLNSGSSDNTEENNYILPNENPEQVECSVDPNQIMGENLSQEDEQELVECSVDPSQVKDENLSQNVQASDTNVILQVQKTEQSSSDKRKFASIDESPKHIESSRDYLSSPYLVNIEVNQCRDGQVTNALKNLENLNKRISLDQEFIKNENPHEHSAILHPNQFLKQNNDINDYQAVQVIDDPMNDGKKRKLNSLEERIEEIHSMLVPDTMKKDEYQVFGDYVASELKKLSPKAFTLAKHYINKILFQANVGNYDSPSNSRS